MKKDLTKFCDLTADDVEQIMKRAFAFREKYLLGVRRENQLDGKVVALVFEKPSLRTKVAFEVATLGLGGQPVFLSSSQILASGNNQRGRESIPDIGRNLERFADMIVARVYSHETIRVLAQSVSKPVINALCDQHHPTQALADLMAIRMHKPDRKDLKVVFVGDGNNVATSLMQMSLMMGMDFSIASPLGYEIPLVEQKIGHELAARSAKKVEFIRDPFQAIQNADVVYSDTFISMGQESEQNERLNVFEKYQVNQHLMRSAKKDAVFMHCLPAHRGEEVTDDVMDSAQSIVFDQAECRLHVAKALIAIFLG